MRVLRITYRALAYVAGGAVLAVVFSPLLLFGLVCLAGLAVFLAIVFGLALGLAAVCALIFESLVGLPFWLGMCLAGTGAVAMTAYLLISGFNDGDGKADKRQDQGWSGLCRLMSWLIGLWAASQLLDREPLE
ncbi:MAG: hypothetical protein QMC81_08965 [Thermoanaerobacterales bacterium]|nr:hypothetical protein [Thermoanaerobacterales bacterium]